MKKNYIISIISVFFIITFLIFSLISCDIFKTSQDNINLSSGQSDTSETTTSFDLTKELNILKEKLVNPPIITSNQPYQELTSNNEKELVILRGKADSSSRIGLKVNGVSVDKKYDVDSDGNFEITDGVEIVEGSNTVEVYAVNSNGDKSEPTKLTFLLNVQKNLDYKVYESIDNLVEVSDSYYSKNFEPSVYINGTSLPSTDVYLKVNDKITGQMLASQTGAFAFENVKLDNGENSISVWYVSGDGQPSVAVNKDILVVKDVSS
ncbi:MAG: hypothetical protein ACYDIA_20755, partial [Candidatus Humimicrobiaceae bacterium]